RGWGQQALPGKKMNCVRAASVQTEKTVLYWTGPRLRAGPVRQILYILQARSLFFVFLIDDF
ncbi:MAG: hypothetical protein ACI4VM_07885, partial [Anaerovoracaceae bacterium]